MSLFTISCQVPDAPEAPEVPEVPPEPPIPKIWNSAALIETDNASHAYSPQIAFDSSGNAIAIWHQSFDGIRYHILVNRYVSGIGWGTAEFIEMDNVEDASSPQIAFDNSDNAIAVWNQWDGARCNIWANRYVSGTGWGTAQLIETENLGDAYHPQIAIDSTDNAIVVWYQTNGTSYNIWANRYVPGTGWGTAQLIETDDIGDAFAPQIAIDSSGNAIAVWRQSNGTRYSIFANRYVPGTGWGPAQLIETDNTGNANHVQIAIDSSGNAIAVWKQSNGTRYSIFANRYVPGTGWGTAQLIETDNAGDAEYPQIAFDLSGNAIAIWTQNDGSRFNIWTNLYISGIGWGTAQLIETDNAGDAEYPQIAFDLPGNATAIWTQYDGTHYNIRSNRYMPDTGWGTTEPIETDNTGDSAKPQIAFDSSGNAIAVWQQYDGTRYNIRANTYR